jgi:hypothetical protein
MYYMYVMISDFIEFKILRNKNLLTYLVICNIITQWFILYLILTM